MNKSQIGFVHESINAIWSVYRKYAKLSPHVFNDRVELFDFCASVAASLFIRIMQHSFENLVKSEDLTEENIKSILIEMCKEMENKIISEVLKEKK